MVLGFALILFGLLAAKAGFNGQSLAEAIRGEAGKGFALASISLPDVQLQEGAASGGGTQTAAFSGSGDTTGGARAIVDQGAKIGAGFGCKVVSDYRPGSTVQGGGSSDHSGNDATRAARDISNAKDAITGPPTPQMDAAVEAIAIAFGTRVNGKQRIVKTWNQNGYRLQLIYRTPEYGGHMGHIHFGARKA